MHVDNFTVRVEDGCLLRQHNVRSRLSERAVPDRGHVWQRYFKVGMWFQHTRLYVDTTYGSTAMIAGVYLHSLDPFFFFGGGGGDKGRWRCAPLIVVVAVCKFRIFLFLRLRPTYFFRSMWPTLTQHVSIAWQHSSSECSSACLNVCCSFEDVLLDPTPILILYIFWKTNFSSPTAGGGLLPGSPTIVSDLSNGIKVASEYIPGNWSAISGTLSFCCLFFNLVKLIVYCCCLHLHQSIFHHSSVLQSVYKQSQHCLPRVSFCFSFSLDFVCCPVPPGPVRSSGSIIIISNC